jgi:HTH-type transcriptional regulator/antitoxin HigA
MKIKPILTEKDYQVALKRVEKIWGSKLGTAEGDEPDVLCTLIEKYEDKYYPIEAPDPVEAIKYIMEEKGLERKDLIKIIGNKSRVSDLLNRKRELSKNMIKALHEHLGISYEILMA